MTIKSPNSPRRKQTSNYRSPENLNATPLFQQHHRAKQLSSPQLMLKRSSETQILVSWRHRPKELRNIKQREQTTRAKSALISTSTMKIKIYLIYAEAPSKHYEIKINISRNRIFSEQVRSRSKDFGVNLQGIPKGQWEYFKASGQNTVWRRSCVLLCCFWAFSFSPGAWCLS